MKIIDPEKGEGKLVDHLTADVKTCVVVSWHGVGDQVMLRAPFEYLKKHYPAVKFYIGLASGLQEEVLFEPEEVILLEGDWRETVGAMGYDLVFLCHFPGENLDDTTKTKAEISCEKELGIVPTSGHYPPLVVKPLVGVHFHNTSVGWLANPTEEVARKVWNEIIEAGCIPIETHICHGFHNPENKKFDFVDQHLRDFPARLETMISIISRLNFFVGAVSGPFHLALSLLPWKNVMLLEKELKSGHFTKQPISTADVKNYKDGTVRAWLSSQSRIVGGGGGRG
jgi:hypothetical protein